MKYPSKDSLPEIPGDWPRVGGFHFPDSYHDLQSLLALVKELEKRVEALERE